MNRDLLKADLIREEGCVLHAYEDHLGYLTIGIGRLIDPRKGGGISKTEADYLLENDIDRVATELARAIPWLKYTPEPVQRALLEMSFQMGTAGLLGFRKMLAAIEGRNYREAAQEALRSRWARQTPERAHRVADLIRNA